MSKFNFQHDFLLYLFDFCLVALSPKKIYKLNFRASFSCSWLFIP